MGIRKERRPVIAPHYTDYRVGGEGLDSNSLSGDNKATESDGGYEFTGAFADRSDPGAQSGANTQGNFVLYQQELADARRWMRFGFSQASQVANDVSYFPTEEFPDFDQTKGLFGGAHMPAGVTDLFDFDENNDTTYNDAVLVGDFQYTSASGSLDFNQCQVGDLALVRFDFELIPQTANTTVEVAIIWETRDADNNRTFIFPLTGTPQFFGSGTSVVGETFLMRPLLSAYFASAEDLNARALLAIRADSPVQVSPLTTLVTIQR